MFKGLRSLIAAIVGSGFSDSDLQKIVRQSQRNERDHGTHYTKKGPGRRHNSDGIQRRLLLIKDPKKRKIESWRLGVGPFPYVTRD